MEQNKCKNNHKNPDIFHLCFKIACMIDSNPQLKKKYCYKPLHYGVALSFAIGVGMFFLSFFHGNVLAGIFSTDTMVIEAATNYLKAYAIDCLFWDRPHLRKRLLSLQ